MEHEELEGASTIDSEGASYVERDNGDNGENTSNSEASSSQGEPDSEDDEGSSSVLRLWKTVSRLEAPGTFACGGSITTILPGLHIEGFGDVGLPLQPRDAKEIISLCQQAPFGRGTETIVDTTVRNTWQLSPSQIQLKNWEFVEQIELLVGDVAVELGLDSSANAAAHLYKLLLYEPGGFFVPHKDTEKEKGMFATLVVTLPSSFEGGELIVTHQGVEKTFTPENSFTTSYVSFFADCKHEIKPVTSGYRLALVYNVVSLDEGPLPKPASSEAIDITKERLRNWKNDDKSPAKHEYTFAGLSYQVLKNEDRAMAQLLLEAVKGEKFELLLGLVNYSVAGGIHGYSKKSGIKEPGHESYYARALVDENGDPVNFKIPITETEFYPPNAFANRRADSESVEEATGNEGATIELRYQRAAIILWPNARWIDIVCEWKTSKAVAYLVNMMADCTDLPRETVEWQNVVGLATRLVNKTHRKPNNALLEALLNIGDEMMITTYLRQLNSWTSDDEQFYSTLGQCVDKFGWKNLAGAIAKFAERLSMSDLTMLLTALEICEIEDKLGNDTRRAICQKLIKECERDGAIIRVPILVNKVAPDLLPAFFQALAESLYHEIGSVVAALKKLYTREPIVAQWPAFAALVQKYSKLLKKSIDDANAREDDWSIVFYKLTTDGECDACKPLAEFLKSPTETLFKFEEPADHVQNAIGLYGFGFWCDNLARLVRVIYQDNSVKKVEKESDVLKKKGLKAAELLFELNTIKIDIGEAEIDEVDIYINIDKSYIRIDRQARWN